MLVDSLSRFTEYIERSELRLPADTVAYEEGSKVSIVCVCARAYCYSIVVDH